jgi:carbonic anhydrase
MRYNDCTRRIVAGIAMVGGLVIAGCTGQDPPTPSATTATTATPAAAPGPVAWHYEGETGPAHWGKLSPQFAACGEGRAQSPIDISNPVRGTAPELKTSFPPAALRIVHHEHLADGLNNGHTIQINYAGADTLTFGGASYQLAQYHFHAPSEHALNGKPFPMEMHMVHKAADGRLAVIGTFIQEGARNDAFEPVWSNLPAQKGSETHYPAVKVDVDALLPAVRTTYRYDGSLTTPPCSEGVAWIVMTTPIELSKEQIGAFTRLVSGNNRPRQPLNGRTLMTDALTITSVR